MSPEERLQAVRDALFPPPVQNSDRSQTLHDAYENLCAALYDLRRLEADKVCITTIEKVLRRLQLARELLTDQ